MEGTQQNAWIGVKDALARFGHQASNRPHAERERQCGELLLELLKLADRMNVDLRAFEETLESIVEVQA